MKLALISPMETAILQSGPEGVFRTHLTLTTSDDRASSMAENQDSTPAKSCTICKQTKPLTAFSPNKNGKLGRQPWCRPCKNAKQKAERAISPTRLARIAKAAAYRADPARKEHRRKWQREYDAKPGVREKARQRANKWKAENPERRRATFKRWQLKTAYGITPEQVEAMREAQHNLCGICEKPFKGVPYVDHDHATDEVRGLLCNGCNMGLGQMERPGFLASCTQYLERHERSKLKMG